MLLALWSPKGGSGTSVVAASLALVAASRGVTRLADLGGDQPTILGLPATDVSGPRPAGALGDSLTTWLAFGPSAPTEWLDDMAFPVIPSLTLLPRDRGEAGTLGAAGPEAGAALGTALRDGATTVIDAGSSMAAPVRALIDVADQVLMVVRPCYLALRRAVGDHRLHRSSGAILVDEPGRVLAADDVAAVLGVPVVAQFSVRPDIARAVDAGVIRDHLPAPLAAPAAALLDTLLPRAGGEWAA